MNIQAFHIRQKTTTTKNKQIKNDKNTEGAPVVFYKKGVLENLAKFTGKHCV